VWLAIDSAADFYPRRFLPRYNPDCANRKGQMLICTALQPLGAVFQERDIHLMNYPEVGLVVFQLYKETKAMKKLLAATLLVAVVAVTGCSDTKKPAAKTTAPAAGDTKPMEKPAETPKAP
jgi:hypothetical protein